ncbi:MAG: DNA/RNA non-specific endonuclease [Alloprevotella sp.]|nr:DNA/RNA non-specific endonuclease [Alloprevotella sp.]
MSNNKPKLPISRKGLWSILGVLCLCQLYVFFGGKNTSDEATQQESLLSILQENGTDASAENDTPSSLLIQKLPEGVRSQILTRRGYTVSYNADNKIPNYVAWKLTAAHSRGYASREDMEFRTDSEAQGARVDTYDYMNSGYDRGHMCPAGDNKWDEKALAQTFLFSNICPQHRGLNANDWNELEQQTRVWARKYGEVYVVCGPVLYARQHKTIGKHKVVVPEAFYKVVMRTDPKPQAIGFIFKNNGSSQPKESCAVSVDEVEQITGIDFFSALPDSVENRIEAQFDKSMWVWQNFKK